MKIQRKSGDRLAYHSYRHLYLSPKRDLLNVVTDSPMFESLSTASNCYSFHACALISETFDFDSVIYFYFLRRSFEIRNIHKIYNSRFQWVKVKLNFFVYLLLKINHLVIIRFFYHYLILETNKVELKNIYLIRLI